MRVRDLVGICCCRACNEECFALPFEASGADIYTLDIYTCISVSYWFVLQILGIFEIGSE